jgi:alpha-1,2-mannosyltransferase
VRALLLAALAAFAVLLPLVPEALAPAIVSTSYRAGYARFELLGFSGGTSLLLLAALAARERRGRSWLALVPSLLPLLVTLWALVLVSEWSRKPFDYDCYEYAGRVLLAGGDPYRQGLLYLYPPLLAQGMAGAWLLVRYVASFFGSGLGDDAAWDLVFYLYQCAQVGLVAWLAVLGARFARRIGLPTPWAEVLVAVLLVFGNPLLRTLRHGQVNLLVLDLALAGALAARSRPALAGVAIALAGHVKLYPLTLLLPLVVVGRRRAAAWALGTVAAVIALQTGFGRDLSLWSSFLDRYAGVGGEVAFRNASVHSVLYNAIRLLGAPRPAAPVASALAKAASAAALGWLALRVLARERARRDGRAADEPSFLADAGDCLALALLASPSAWEHHFLFALPLALVAVARRGAERPGAVALGLFLVFGMPTFDLFPFGYHRLAGLLLLLWITPAARAPSGPAAPRAAPA